MAVRVLAVGDPAVYAYVDPDLHLVDRCRDITGHTVDFAILPWAEYGDRVFAEAGSAAPAYDIVMLPGHLWLPQFVEQGALRALNPNGPLFAREYDPEDILPGVGDEMYYRGERYLTPSFSDGHILFAHRGFDRLIDTQSGRAEVDRFAEVAAQNEDTGTAFILKKAPSEIFLDWLPYLRRFGGEFLYDDGSPGFTGTAGRHAAEYYRDLAQRLDQRHAPFGNEEVAIALRSGTVGFGVSWGGQAGQIVDKDSRATLRYATLSEPWNVTWSFGILARSSQPQQAEEVLAVLTDSQSDKLVGEFAGSPSRASSYADGALRERCPWFPAQEDLLKTARPLPSRPDLPALLGPISAALSDIVDNGVGVKESLDKAARSIIDG